MFVGSNFGLRFPFCGIDFIHTKQKKSHGNNKTNNKLSDCSAVSEALDSGTFSSH